MPCARLACAAWSGNASSDVVGSCVAEPGVVPGVVPGLVTGLVPLSPLEQAVCEQEQEAERGPDLERSRAARRLAGCKVELVTDW